MGTPRQQVGGSRFQGVAGTLWLVSPQRSAFIEASTSIYRILNLATAFRIFCAFIDFIILFE